MFRKLKAWVHWAFHSGHGDLKSSSSKQQNYHSQHRKSLSASAMSAAVFEEQPPPQRQPNSSQPRRPSTSPPVCDQRSNSPGPTTGKGHKSRRLLPQARPGRSLSLKNEQIPAALLVGDYLIAPLYEWAERLRLDSSFPPQTTPQIEDPQNEEDASSTMPGTPCLNSACGEEFDPSAASRPSTSRSSKYRSSSRRLFRRIRNSFIGSRNNEEDRPSALAHHETSNFLHFGPLFSCALAHRFSFGSDFSDEDPPSIQPRTLEEYTPLLKNVIRAIRRMHVLVARRKFKEALKPYDVKDVIEQYSAGHVDLQARVKQVQQKLDQIVGGKQANKEDLKVNLVSRVVKVEKQVEKIDKKIDLLVEMFLEDRRHRLINNGMRTDPASKNPRQKTTRHDSSPPHSATGRLTTNSPSQQLIRHKKSVPAKASPSTSVGHRPKRQASLLTSLPLSSLHQSLDEPENGSSSENMEMYSVRSHFSNSNEPNEKTNLLQDF
ncbi:KCNQ potassium channel [Aphelenchoides bicaudatus]|nr:KCNQ potassium channel [Aphelenchoides bicaudatus]